MSAREIPHSRPLHDGKDAEAAASVLRTQMTAAGSLARALSNRLQDHFGGPYAATAASGTLALVESLRALDVGTGDHVVLPTYICPEVLDAVWYLGAEPVLCDIDPSTFAPSAETVAAVWTHRARVAIVPHMFGIPAGVEEIVLAGVPVVEDLAQGLGARVGQRPAGAVGMACALSFKAIKMLSAGEGGAVVVRDPEAADRLAALHARRNPQQPSFSFPLSDLSSAVALAQWDRLEEFLTRRRKLASLYLDCLADLAGHGLGLPQDTPGCAWFRFPVRLPPRVAPLALRQAMAAHGIHARQPVDTRLHRLLNLSPAKFPHAERVFAATLSLPLYPALTEAELDWVAQVFRTTFIKALDSRR